MILMHQKYEIDRNIKKTKKALLVLDVEKPTMQYGVGTELS